MLALPANYGQQLGSLREGRAQRATVSLRTFMSGIPGCKEQDRSVTGRSRPHEGITPDMQSRDDTYQRIA